MRASLPSPLPSPLLGALLAAAAVAAAPAAVADGGSITFVMTSLRNDKGIARCALHDKEDAFPRKPEQAVATTSAPIKGGSATCVFTGVRPGTYAISGFHDENDNGRLDMGLFGPTEGWAASNDARGAFGPKFKDAKFDYKGGALGLKASVVY
jgi:uncharacterized protein (DUF2141 family)